MSCVIFIRNGKFICYFIFIFCFFLEVVDGRSSSIMDDFSIMMFMFGVTYLNRIIDIFIWVLGGFLNVFFK